MKPADLRESRYQVRDGVAWVTLNRPEKLNAFTSRLYDELRWGIRFGWADDAVDIIVITGVGRAFATGGDLDEVLARLDEDDDLSMHAFFDALPWSTFRSCPKVIIAAVNGLAYAGGFITAACADISIAAESARFALTEGVVGIADAFAPALLFNRVGSARLKYLLLTGAPVPATEAARQGLITECVPDDHLRQRVEEVIAEVRRVTPSARKMYKSYVDQLISWPVDHGGWEAFTSPEIKTALRRFTDRR
jgi:2-(1,2-epoxy-1,2-dihydrophenyl)acetyl-CoA isomerase